MSRARDIYLKSRQAHKPEQQRKVEALEEAVKYQQEFKNDILIAKQKYLRKSNTPTSIPVSPKAQERIDKQVKQREKAVKNLPQRKKKKTDTKKKEEPIGSSTAAVAEPPIVVLIDDNSDVEVIDVDDIGEVEELEGLGLINEDPSIDREVD